MIHAFALEPNLVASWGRKEEFRFIHDKFGLGTARVMLELPAWTKWKKAVYAAALELGLSQEDMNRVAEIFRLFEEHRCRRANVVSDGTDWLERAEREYDRKRFAAILAGVNPRNHAAVLPGDQLPSTDPRWVCATGAHPARTAQAITTLLSPMLANCRELHLVDPHFSPCSNRFRSVVQEIAVHISSHNPDLRTIHVHCDFEARNAPELAEFEAGAARMALSLPAGLLVEFTRWRQVRDKLHDRFVLTDLGGVLLGTGLDEGADGETQAAQLLPRNEYLWHWDRYARNDGTFQSVERPVAVRRTPPAPRH